MYRQSEAQNRANSQKERRQREKAAKEKRAEANRAARAAKRGRIASEENDETGPSTSQPSTSNAKQWELRGQKEVAAQTEEKTFSDSAVQTIQQLTNSATQTEGAFSLDDVADLEKLRQQIGQLETENERLKKDNDRLRSEYGLPINLDQIQESTFFRSKIGILEAEIHRQRRTSAPGRTKSPLGDVSNWTIRRRSSQVAEYLRENVPGPSTPKARIQQKQVLKKAVAQIVTPSPEKQVQRPGKMTAQEDLGVTLLTGISFKQRRKLKILLGGRDPFSSTRQFEKEKKKLAQLTEYEWSPSGECIYCTNIKQVIARRVQAMERSGYDLIQWPDQNWGIRRVQIALVGDYGGKGKAATTKFGMQIDIVEMNPTSAF